MSCTGKRRAMGLKSAAVVGLSALLVACATGPTQYKAMTLTPEQQQHVLSQPSELKVPYERLYQEGRRNEVLNLMEVGLTAYKAGYYDVAEKVLDTAILNINGVYADNDAAQKARSLWHEEGRKDFKGEPYERSMVFFYRGLLYLRNADYDNARASFINGIMHDAFAEEDQNRSDFALFLYLAGWSAMQMGSDELAQAHFDELKVYRPDADIPTSNDTVLAIVETGKSPRKLADGKGHYQLVYRRGKKFKENRVALSYGGWTEKAYPMEDIFFQASTRGGRTVDKIIEGKVAFKKNTEDFGSSLSSVTNSGWMAGYAASHGASGTNAYAAVTMVSVAAMALSANTKPRADTRYWKTLPDTVHVKTFPVQQDVNTVEAHYSNQEGTAFPELSNSESIHFDRNRIGLVHISSR